MHPISLLLLQFGQNLILRNKIIIRHEYGQLGNILFRLSNALAYAREFDYKVEDYTLAFCNYHDGSSNIRFFENYYTFHFFEYPCPKSRLINRLKWKLREKIYRNSKTLENFEPSFDLTDLPSQSTYELKGFHFSAKDLVNKYRKKICQILDFKRSLKEPIDKLFKETRTKYSLILGVHIRANDYKDFYNGNFFVPICQYLEIIKEFKQLNNKRTVDVVVCSDDKELLQEIKSMHPTFITPRGSVAQDIYALSKCHYLIGPKATTFSPWASYLGQIPLFQVSKDSKLVSMNSFKRISYLEPLNLFSN